ncbi:MAG: bifunctional histidinol-phosphatase/imidazoleglycerol-phosphate dehydratase HisB [Bacteroidetes bacterium]|nr:bifunctional histidinol-phosphatase/imidazoleglycerol-phosphate dehydratase HisB [Bacteroidota bacterium]MBU1113802.1 bifunctional histidinol-phosphatase/imidazoleglycerol-phosphate dehydratase HisB [Bacteroidota bacterium]MBU1799612.1 bifunctional histidinol-phosphatase/imidazoleglycerol-phosphate dehydratase HisB [Bacteroidota bacterium]
MKKVLFIDRDGTIIIEPEDEQIDSLEKLEFYPKAISVLAKIAKELDYELVMVTNQDGLGTESFPENTFYPAQNKMLTTLKNEGVEFAEIIIDKSFPHENLPTRKPGIALLSKYISGDYDLANSYVIGDRTTDVQLAKNLGTKSIFLNNQFNTEATLTTLDWDEIFAEINRDYRTAIIVRKTKETEIKVELNLDGKGKHSINTGLHFFDHMLAQLSQHSLCDLNINVIGDLEVDEHHTIEDTAIALGEAFLSALGNKKKIERYGFMLPMDDVIASAAIDFSGRSWLQWKVKFKREFVGDVPTEMFFHFFKSFSDAAKCNLYIKAKGENEHHKIEAIFKAFGRSIKQAVSKNTSNADVPSTKGVI